MDVDLTVVVDSPVGRRTVGDGLSFPALDLFIHAWDVARSVGKDVVIPTEAIEFAHVIFEPIPEEQMRQPPGVRWPGGPIARFHPKR